MIIDNPFFSLIIWADKTNTMYFRDTLASIAEQDFPSYEVIIMDQNPYGEIGRISGEFFPESGRLNYRQLKKSEGRAYALNVGLHFARGDYFMIIGQHDRISPDTLSKYKEIIDEGKKQIKRAWDGTITETSTEPEVLYCDMDEIRGDDRVNPHFKGGFNKWLLMQDNYIGEFICLKKTLCRRVGFFREGLNDADIYEYLLRCVMENAVFYHVPLLLFHRRMMEVNDMAVLKKLLRDSYENHVKVAKAFLIKNNIDGDIVPDGQCRYWKIRLNGDDPEKHKREYMLLKSRQVRVLTGQSKKIMYAYLSQPDVGIVGVCFRGPGMNIDNCGYIYDTDGIIYPACYGKPLFSDGYENRIILTQEVSMVDFSYCMIDANVYQHLKGFRPEFTERDAILDYCLRVRQSGYKILYVSDVVARNAEKNNDSSYISNDALRERWGELLSMGDPYYNINLPMGIENYQLY